MVDHRVEVGGRYSDSGDTRRLKSVEDGRRSWCCWETFMDVELEADARCILGKRALQKLPEAPRAQIWPEAPESCSIV